MVEPTPNLVNIGPHRICSKFGRSPPAMRQVWLSVARILPSSVRFGPSALELGPELVDIGHRRVRRRFVRTQSAFGRHPPSLPTRPRFGPTRPTCSQTRQTFAAPGPNRSQIGLNLAQVCPNLIELVPHCSFFVFVADFGSIFAAPRQGFAASRCHKSSSAGVRWSSGALLLGLMRHSGLQQTPCAALVEAFACGIFSNSCHLTFRRCICCVAVRCCCCVLDFR